MIRFIAAIDNKRGIANEHGLPWQGQLPSEVKYYHDKIFSGGALLMGFGLYKELPKPYHSGTNYVAIQGVDETLREGFEPVEDAHKFLENVTEDVWNLGGAILFETTLDLADELYLTLIDRDFNCTKFFPQYEQDFELVSKSEPHEENGISFVFTVWKRKTLKPTGAQSQS